jgi:GT2 family glycosyltransferase
LPPAATLAERAAVLCLGSAGAAWERQLAGPVWGWPGFDAVQIHSPEHARLLASWLNGCNQAGLQLVRLVPSPAELQADGWAALARPPSPAPGWLPPQRFNPPLHPGELLAELAWRAAGAPPEAAVITPAPSHQVLWTHQAGTPALAAVCVSLFNYAGRILSALESVRVQSLEPLELLIVDDGSSDDGPALVQQWLAEHGQRFSRVLLVQHTRNAGLAAARNTAFSLATAPWCFVLDADNQLEPDAVAHCLALAAAAPNQIAVVHPLVELVIEGDPLAPQLGDIEPSALISGLSWQRAHFLERNVVDAMALVRHSAWQQVGGYDDIPGGWEDYDFWCKLIEAGWQGILCPQRLARYHRHSRSMLATQTHLRLRRVSRVLQQRHPWLQLALAAAHT